jgi:exodeoxyribonuclease VII large subunit
MRRVVLAERASLAQLERRLAARHPHAVIGSCRARLGAHEAHLRAIMVDKLATARRELASSAARLDAMSPLSVLSRGYAIATDQAGRAIRDATSTQPGDRIGIRVSNGRIVARVEEARADLVVKGRDDG